MGMFDNVNVKVRCECGHLQDDFQSKDGPCFLEKVELSDVREFYSGCDKCGKRIHFRQKFPRSIEDFDRVAASAREGVAE